MKKSSLKASSLKNTLVFLIVTMVLVSIGGFYYAQDQLDKVSADIYRASTQASMGNSSPQDLLKVRNEISKNQAMADKAKKLIGTAQGYQAQISNDIRKYAQANNVQLAGVEPKSDINPAPFDPNIKTGRVEVTFKNPTSLDSFLMFLKGIESNLPKMQVTGINISRVSGANGFVNVQPIIIETYFR